jgi:stage V sporulation protein AB
MMNSSRYVLETFVGISSGIAIGSAFVAILTFLGVIPRLIQLSESRRFVRYYSIPIISGTFVGTYLSFTDFGLLLPVVFLSVWGMLHGIFVGMLAAALVEVLNVFPLLSRRVGLERYYRTLLMAVVFGKIFGSLFQWLYVVHY